MTKDVIPSAGPAVVVHAEQCKGCGRCVDACPNKILVFSTQYNSHGYLTPEVGKDGCTGCGICFYTCPEPDAITVYKKARGKADDEK